LEKDGLTGDGQLGCSEWNADDRLVLQAIDDRR